MGSWTTRPLGEICNITGGGTPSKSESIFYGGPIPWATVRDMKSDHISQTEFSITEEAVKKSSTNVIPAHNVVIATRVGLGKVCILTNDTAINQDLRGIIPKDPQQLNIRYLFWWLKSVAHRIESAGTGATVKGVKLPFVKGLEVPLPPLPEQQRIVSMLDQAFEGIAAAIAKAEQNLKNARELFDSYRFSVFASNAENWKTQRLGDLTTVQSGGTPLKSTKAFWDGGQIPWYSSGELNDLYTTDSANCITEAGLNGSNAKLFPTGSLLIGMYDTAALKMSIIDRDATFNQAIAGAMPNADIDLVFVMHAINAAKPEILNQRRGVRQKNLSLGKIKDISIPFPALAEQKAVVEKLSALGSEVDRLESIYQQKLNALTELKQSLLQKAFAGELH